MCLLLNFFPLAQTVFSLSLSYSRHAHTINVDTPISISLKTWQTPFERTLLIIHHCVLRFFSKKKGKKFEFCFSIRFKCLLVYFWLGFQKKKIIICEWFFSLLSNWQKMNSPPRSWFKIAIISHQDQDDDNKSNHHARQQCALYCYTTIILLYIIYKYT